jgi:hypothetical protein
MAVFNFLSGTVRTNQFYDTTPGSNKIVVDADAFINVDDDWSAIGVGGSGVWDVSVNGGLWASHDPSVPGEGHGLEFQNYLSTINSKLFVGAEGAIGGERQGVQSNVALNITNFGFITGGREAISFYGFQGPDEDGSESNLNQAGKQIKVDNKIGGQIASYFVGVANNSYATITVNNDGEIYGGKGNSYSDEWHGAAIYSQSTLKLTNKGYIEGDIGTGWFGNVITNMAEIEGTVWGYIERNDDDIVDLDRDGDFTDFATGGAVHQDNITGLASTIVNKGVIYGNEEYGRNDNDTPDDPDDDEYFQVALDLSRGKDIVTNSGKIFGDVWLGGGDDIITNTGTIEGYVDGWRGNDTIINKGTIEYGIGGGDGNDVLNNTGKINGDVDLGDGNNLLINTGFIADGVWGGSQNDVVTNSGVIDDDVDLNGGNDVLTNTGTINGWIDLGSGSDRFIGGKQDEYVGDWSGTDSYLLGDGNDHIWMSDDGAADSVDGGKGSDVLHLEDIDHGISLNLAAKTLNSGGATDTIVGFEKIIGTEFADTFVGSSLGEQIKGNGGGDTFTGGGGGDFMKGSGGAVDTFIFTAITDSGKTKATRDLIGDFSADEDIIKILFDANTTGGGAGDDFTTLLANTTFTGHAGELRYIWRGIQTVVEGDVNGDGKADFSIAIDGHVELSMTDFLFS